MKFLIGNKLNDFCLDTHYSFLSNFWSVLFQFSWRSWNISLIAAALFDELYFRYVLWNSYKLLLFLLIGILVGRPFNAKCSENIFLNLDFYFAFIICFIISFFKKNFEKNYLLPTTFHKLVTFSISPCYL